MATVDPVEITPTLQNCSITEPAKSSDGGYYLDPSHMTVTLKANAGYIFETDGTLTYQTSSSSTVPIDIKANKADTATVSLPSDISWDDNFSFPLTMSAVKTTTTPVTPKQPTQPTKPVTQTVQQAQLTTLKNSLRVPLDLTQDDKLLQGYLDSATEYLASALGDEHADRLNSQRAKVFVNSLAEILYQNRGETTMKSLPYALQALLNQLKY